MSNEKIEGAFERWEITSPECLAFAAEATYPIGGGIRLGFHAGYTSRNAEIEHLKKDKEELLYSLKLARDDVDFRGFSYAKRGGLYADKMHGCLERLKVIDSLIERMKQ